MAHVHPSEVDHTPARAQGWPEVDADVGDWVNSISDALIASLGRTLVAVYLHGSLAMGSYYRPKSDLDLLVVVDRGPSEPARRALAAGLLEAFDRRPSLGGLEVSVVTRAVAAAPQHPVAFDSHFSEHWAEAVRVGGAGPRGRDPDLAAHFATTRARGISLVGEPPHAVLGDVGHDAFLAALLDDLRWITDGGIHESPVYGTLNACRVLSVLAEGPGYLPSKEEGARWALDRLPARFETVVAQALECYCSGADVTPAQRRTHGHGWAHRALRALSDHTASIALAQAGR